MSNISSPTEKLAKWLVPELRSYPSPEGFSVTNSMDLVDNVKNAVLLDDEVLISFDVTSLFPSIPIEDTLDCLHDW